MLLLVHQLLVQLDMMLVYALGGALASTSLFIYANEGRSWNGWYLKVGRCIRFLMFFLVCCLIFTGESDFKNVRYQWK